MKIQSSVVDTLNKRFVSLLQPETKLKYGAPSMVMLKRYIWTLLPTKYLHLTLIFLRKEC